MNTRLSKTTIKARLAVDDLAKNIENLPQSDNEKRDNFLYATLVMATAWKLHASKNTGNLLIGFPFVGVDQESAVADVPQELLTELRKFLNH